MVVSRISVVAAMAMCSAASAQWYWPAGVGVQPACPAPSDDLTFLVAGDWPDACPPEAVRVHVTGFEVDVDLLHFVAPGPCPTVITAYRLEATHDPLPAGEYTVFTTYFVEGVEHLPRERVTSFIVDPACAECYADCDGSGELDFFDFLCFQNAFSAGDPYADCDGDGELDFFDFLCFQNEFSAGCP